MVKLKLFGLGGQGVVTAAKALSTAVSIYEDAYAITVPAYGHERRGAPVYTSVIIDEEPVLLNCFVYEPDIVVVMDDGIADRGIDVGAGTHRDSVLILNTSSRDRACDYKTAFGFKTVYYADTTGIAQDTIGRSIPNSAMLGVLARSGLVDIASIEKAVAETFGPERGPKNAEAAKGAYHATEIL